MNDIEFVPILVLGLVAYTLLNLVKYVRDRNWNGVVTLVTGWVVGVIAVWVVAESNWGETITVGGSRPLSLLSFLDILLVGLVVVSAGSVLFDFKKSFDNTDSAQTPELVRSKAVEPKNLH